MPKTVRPDLADADGGEVTDYLLGLGWTAIQTNLNDDPALMVEAEGAGDLDADLDAFEPTAARGEYIHVPPELKGHKDHAKAYLEAERDGTMAAWTAAEFRSRTGHALADAIAYLRKNNPDA